jgi:DNA-binding NarL/FixJ family response regulator
VGEPLRVGVLALEPMLGLRVGSALCRCPEVSVVPPGEAVRVVVLTVDAITGEVLDLVREVRGGAHRPALVLVATEPTVGTAMDATAAGAGGVLRGRDVEPARLGRAVLAAAGGDRAVPPDVPAELSEQGVGRTLPGGGPAGHRTRAVACTARAGLI